jgi:predicted outer membrane repeat protein
MALLLFAPAPASAVEVFVPDHFGTIQEALDAVVNGDIITVRDGLYTGPGNKNLDFAGKAVTLRSENGYCNSAIDLEDNGRAFIFQSSETSTSVVDGFCIRNGFVEGAWPDNSGGAIFCRDSSPTIVNCGFSWNRAVYGAAIYAFDSSPIIEDCVFIENEAGRFGGAIALFRSDSSSVSDCRISGNSAGEFGGGIYCFGASTSMVNCEVTGNWAGERGGGIYLAVGEPKVVHCTISDNYAGVRAGGLESDSAATLLVNSILWNNSLTVPGPKVDVGQEIVVDAFYGPSTLTVSHTDVEGGEAAALILAGAALVMNPGNIDADPLFFNPGSWSGTTWVSGDYRLTDLATTSPCIDTGVDAGIVRDIFGDVRPQGAGFDMGSDEFLVISIDSFTATPDLVPDGTFSALAWDTTNATMVEIDQGVGPVQLDGMIPVIPAVTTTYTLSASSLLVATPVTAQVTVTVVPRLSQINLGSPTDGSVLTSPPTFVWTALGGITPRFAVDASLSPTFTPKFFSTFPSEVLSGNTWMMPSSVWDMIPVGATVYWRVRGRDLNENPLTIITSDEVWSFDKSN